VTPRGTSAAPAAAASATTAATSAGFDCGDGHHDQTQQGDGHDLPGHVYPLLSFTIFWVLAVCHEKDCETCRLADTKTKNLRALRWQTSPEPAPAEMGDLVLPP
jgi:hypothetical protein